MCVCVAEKLHGKRERLNILRFSYFNKTQPYPYGALNYIDSLSSHVDRDSCLEQKYITLTKIIMDDEDDQRDYEVEKIVDSRFVDGSVSYINIF